MKKWSNWDDPESGGSIFEVASSNLAWSLLKIFVFLFLAVVMINAKKEEEAKDKGGIKIPGNISFTVLWNKEINADVDIHMKDPNGEWIWHRQKNTHFCDLVRDDRGFLFEENIQPEYLVNLENIFCRGIASGEYIVNLHMFPNAPSFAFPVKVLVTAEIHRLGADEPVKLFEREVYLRYFRHEITVFRFSLNEDGKITAQDANPILVSHADEMGGYGK